MDKRTVLMRVLLQGLKNSTKQFRIVSKAGQPRAWYLPSARVRRYRYTKQWLLVCLSGKMKIVVVWGVLHRYRLHILPWRWCSTFLRSVCWLSTDYGVMLKKITFFSDVVGFRSLNFSPSVQFVNFTPESSKMQLTPMFLAAAGREQRLTVVCCPLQSLRLISCLPLSTLRHSIPPKMMSQPIWAG